MAHRAYPQIPPFPRREDYAGLFGDCLSVTADLFEGRLLVELDHPCIWNPTPVRLDGYGVAILIGFLEAAADGPNLADDEIDGSFPASLSLATDGLPQIRIRRPGASAGVDVPAAAWAWLKDELELVLAATIRQVAPGFAAHLA